VRATLEEWQAHDKVRRIWDGDASLWANQDENKWLGWLRITTEQLAHSENLRAIAGDIQSAGFRDALLLGMGGSSLCPEVLRMTFGLTAGFPDLHVLDSTDPAQVKAREKQIDLPTLFSSSQANREAHSNPTSSSNISLKE